MSTDTAASPAPAPAPTQTQTQTRKLSLRARWTTAFVLAGAVPLALLGYTTLGIQRNGLTEAALLHETAAISQAVKVLENDLHEASEATHHVGMVLTDPGLPDTPAKAALAQELMANAAVLARVTVYLPDGTRALDISRSNDTNLPPPPASLPRAEILPHHDGAWLPAEYTPQGAIQRYLEPVRRDGELRAWLVATLRADALSRRMEEVSTDLFQGRRDGVLVIDADNRVLASGVPAGNPLSVGQNLAGRDLLSATRLTGEDFNAPHLSTAEFRANGEDFVGSVRTVPERHWAVLARRPSSEVLTPLADARRSLGLALGGFLLLALGVSTVLVARTVKPIQALMRLASAYGKRQFKTRSEVKSGDEIELLGNQMMDMADSIERTEAEVARRAQVEANLSRFMPAEVAKTIAGGERGLALGGERRAITVLFADVASFTPFAEGTDPERVVAFLNELFGVMMEVVFRHEGTVDKFIGDCVMAVYGAPLDQPDHAARAVATADELHRFVESSAAKWKARYGIEPKLAIGINTGEALVGNLGNESRMEYTCVGDVVNVAARLEAMAQPGQTLVTQEVVGAAGEDFEFNSLGDHPIRGKKQALGLFEVVR